MKLSLDLDGATLALELKHENDRWRFRIGGGAEREAQVRVAEPQVYSVLVDGRVYDAHVSQAGDRTIVVIAGRRFEIGIQDPRRWAKKSGGAGHEGRLNVIAPMPGKIVRVLVAVGDAVALGQGLLVVEAMKMQNEMKAAKAGHVVAIHFQAGATVSAGEILAAIE